MMLNVCVGEVEDVNATSQECTKLIADDVVAARGAQYPVVAELLYPSWVSIQVIGVDSLSSFASVWVSCVVLFDGWQGLGRVLDSVSRQEL